MSPERPGVSGPSRVARRAGRARSSETASESRASPQPSGSSSSIARHCPTRLIDAGLYCVVLHCGRGQGRETRVGEPGDAARLPPRDAAHPALRGEGRGPLPRGRAAGLPPRRDRPGGDRRRGVPGAGGRRRLRLHASRARAHARARDPAERGDGRALREERGLLARLRRLDAPLRHRAREPGRERRRRRRPAADRRGRDSRSSSAGSRASPSRSSATAPRTSATSTSR